MLSIYAISDSIGETAELVAKGIASQFSEEIHITRVPYLKTLKNAQKFIDTIKEEKNLIIISTIILSEVKEFLVEKCVELNLCYISVLSPGINIISQKFNIKPAFKPGNIWSMDDEYYKRISAIEFAIQYDDSKDYNGLDIADIVLVGLSRTSKTPLSMYLAYKGLKVINIPLIPEIPPPQKLFEIDKRKVIALTIDPLKLIEIRKHRLEKLGWGINTSGYTDDQRILEEFDYADVIFKRINCKKIDVTDRAIEDTALIILDTIKK
ncbi:pyruvate, phosphate dikinase/phosphoenolpyruvate synthase regulator [Oceanirhabdus sp. W0125-5]|uniref:pyruvate, phosphate dikinase/phosphoenolpyruvate synthase regulator n=1 Tax=Oceanirhabdus sp. W0125-5 TaxID=2999116 RepID=UPI0022F30C8D|nr:pyruvate, phosphate dikinase/phosphoenolpyruvate synthase regulator [Oceanirhabdus sp. W0125-5]WBW95151.1 pyruvate, phosphate dikinase/phosphoenolpyruvate synthase regulator [Oceanirhabdus sp. W0125-5]